jgi:hypothetical protein
MAKSYIKCLEGEVQYIRQRITVASSLGPSHAITTQATDWENVLVRIVIIVAFFTIELLLIV